VTTVEAYNHADRNSSGHTPLRPVTLEDLPVLAILEKEVFHDLAYSVDTLRVFYNLFQDTWYVADYDGDLAGYELVGLNPKNSHGWLLGLAVSGRYRGRGLGGILMGQALASMMDYEVTDAYLTVRPGNAAARRIYDAFEFEHVEQVPNYYWNNEPRDVLHRSLEENPYLPASP